MARQPRSRPEPAHAQLALPDASASTPEEWIELHARPAPPSDPDLVFRDHAADLADHYETNAADVEKGLRRLATTFLGVRVADAVVLADSLHRPPLTLLADALALMPADAAFRLIQEGDLADLNRRVLTTAWLGSPDTPLYTTDELAAALLGLAADLHTDREHMVRTGLPSRLYPGSQWLYHKLARLYPTRQAASFVPHAERISNPRPGAPPYTWLQTPHRDVFCGGEMRLCEYEQADFLAGLSAADGLRVERDRHRLLDLKIRLLVRTADALTTRQVKSMWADVLKVLSDMLTAADVEFYIGLDGRHPPTLDDLTTADDMRSPGGLTDLLELAGHVEQELTIGTLAAAMSALTAPTRTRLYELTQGSHDRDGFPLELLYLALRAHPEQARLDAAIDALSGQLDLAEAFWAKFRERVGVAIRQEFRVHHVVPLAASHTSTIGPLLASYAAQAGHALKTGRWITNPPVGLNVFRWDGSSWTIIYEGKVVGRQDAVGLFYLRLLLEFPGNEFDARELSRIRGLWNQDRTTQLREMMIQTFDNMRDDGRESEPSYLANDLGELADREAMTAYDVRSEQLLAQIRAAEDIIHRATGKDGIRVAEKDHARAEFERLHDELRQINDHRKKALGVGGKSRRMADEQKKARDAVVKAAKEAVEGFEKGLPALHTHLTAALLLGSTCCYNPAARVNWIF